MNDLSCPGCTIAAQFIKLAEARPDAIALIHGDNRISRSELMLRTRTIASALHVRGIGKGDRVALWLPNEPDWVATFLAASILGATIVTLNPQYRASEISYGLGHSKAVVLVTRVRSGNTDYVKVLSEISGDLIGADAIDSAQLPLLRHIFVAGRDTAPKSWLALDSLKDNDIFLQPSEDGAHPIVVLYTSGTTAAPKGVLQTEASLLMHARAMRAAFQFNSSDRMLSITPFCGIYGLNALLGILMCGGIAVIPTDTAAGATLDLLAAEHVTTISGTVDAVLRRWVTLQREHPRDLSSLAGGAVPVAWLLGSPSAEIPEIERLLGVRVVHAYGLSEGNSTIIIGDMSAPQSERLLIKGKPIDAKLEVTIRGLHDNRKLPDGETGEICLRGPTLMLGYLDDPKETAKAIDEFGWLHTGDIGQRGSDGTTAYIGREKEVIKSSGYTVSPAEIEHFLCSLPGVDAAQAVGLVDPDGKEWIAVGVLASAGAEINEALLIQCCQEKVAYYKVPRMIEVLSAFPTTKGANAEKVQRHVLASVLRKAWIARGSPSS